MYIVNLPKLQNKEKHMDHFHLLFVTLLIFQESKKLSRGSTIILHPQRVWRTWKTFAKKLMSKVPRSEKIDINVTDTSIAYITIYKQKTYMVKTEVVFLRIVPTFVFQIVLLKRTCQNIFYYIDYRVSCYLWIDVRFNFYDYVSQHQHDFFYL